MNDFEHPSLIDKEIDEEIKTIIKKEFETKGKLYFYDAIKFFENAVEIKDIKRSKICAYYCANIVISSDIPDKQKTINDLKIILNGLIYSEKRDKILKRKI